MKNVPMEIVQNLGVQHGWRVARSRGRLQTCPVCETDDSARMASSEVYSRYNHNLSYLLFVCFNALASQKKLVCGTVQHENWCTVPTSNSDALRFFGDGVVEMDYGESKGTKI